MSTKTAAINHIAIIPDGNRRYSREQKISLTKGYNEAIQVFLKTIKTAHKLNTKYITFFCLSTQNLVRPRKEVLPVFKNVDLLIWKIIEWKKYLWFKNNIKISIIGNDIFPKKLEIYQKLMQQINKKIKFLNKYQKMNILKPIINVTLAINYGGIEEIITAVKKAQLNPSVMAYQSFFASQHLPEIDICIRTGNVKRISNFLLWKLAYAELFFVKCYWPKFNAKRLTRIVDSFNNQRIRRFGR